MENLFWNYFPGISHISYIKNVLGFDLAIISDWGVAS